MKMPKLKATLVALLFVAGGAQATPLSALIQGGSITAGDKLFDGWTLVNYTASDPLRAFNADNIEVTALSDGGTNPGPGLSFTVINNELGVTGDGIYAFVDLTFGFHVSVLGTAMQMKGASLAITGASVTTANGVDNGTWITEDIGSTAGASDLGTNFAEASYLDGSGMILNPTDASSFVPRGDAWVSKNILVWATDVTEAASLTGFEQRFSQIPEPATLALVGLSLTGLAVTRRRTA